jgi:cytochrome c oxidase subunit IV
MTSSQQKIDGIPLYLAIYVALMLLLIATVIAGAQDLGAWNAAIALTIAVIKAVLVILFFMHIRHSSKLTWIFSVAAFLWLGLLLALTMTDYTSRNGPAPSSAAQITAGE